MNSDKLFPAIAYEILKVVFEICGSLLFVSLLDLILQR